MENSFVMLSNHGKLYNGNIGSSPKCVMDDVDAGLIYFYVLLYDVLGCDGSKGPYAR